MTEFKIADLTADLKLFNCKNCPFADKCPYADPNRDYCEIERRILSGVFSSSSDQELGIVRWVISQLIRRYARARMFEDLAGGVLDRHTTTLETNLVRILETYFKLKTASAESGQGEDVLAELQKLAEAES
ncbi:MAG: hypothetical protein DRP85_09760 [Candidatus Makaraimicrobium thalassicum]|nr:MAG: hypothetical protein DRP85_09760 [Candidatus Omnitrophota bacterium]